MNMEKQLSVTGDSLSKSEAAVVTANNKTLRVTHKT